VDLAVGVEVARLGKFLAAHGAFKWFFTCVLSHMNFQSARSHKTLGAGVACKWSITCMPPKVVTQVPVGRECPVTPVIRADERLLSIVNSLVRFQVALFCEFL